MPGVNSTPTDGRPGFRATHLFFDLDGTLIDPRNGIVGSIQYALAALGEPTADPASLERFIGSPLVGTFRHLLGTEDRDRIARAITAYRARFGVTGLFETGIGPSYLGVVRVGMGE
jgi:phosphoglycolate phosphatase